MGREPVSVVAVVGQVVVNYVVNRVANWVARKLFGKKSPAAPSPAVIRPGTGVIGGPRSALLMNYSKAAEEA